MHDGGPWYDGGRRGARGGHLRTMLPVVGLLLAVVGCTTPPEPLPAAITCSYQYRPEATSAAGAQEGALVVDRGEQESAVFEQMMLQVTYTAGQPDGNGVRLVLSDRGGQQIAEHLYQGGASAQVLYSEFDGGHGFTGLIYVHHEDAQVQVWCAAAE